jgi:hypothetical protein
MAQFSLKKITLPLPSTLLSHRRLHPQNKIQTGLDMSLPGLLIFTFVILSAAACPRPNNAHGLIAVNVSAEPIAAFDPDDPARRRFGDLEFVGGLVLTSSEPSFGGFSALLIRDDGSRLIALTDRGSWMHGRIVYSASRPEAISDAVMAPVLRSDGKPAGRWDTESITEDGGILFVGVERDNEIIRFEYGKKGFFARGISITVPPGIKDLPENQGLEALAFIPKEYPLGGTLIALSECALNEAGNIKAFLIGGPNPGAFSVRRTGGFDITDAALLPEGDLLILERQYSEQTGVALRIRQIPLAKITPGATVDGRIIIEADSRHVIDNMEALSVHRARSGSIVLTLMSDDNFSLSQRTLLLQFTLIGDGKSETFP